MSEYYKCSSQFVICEQNYPDEVIDFLKHQPYMDEIVEYEKSSSDIEECLHKIWLELKDKNMLGKTIILPDIIKTIYLVKESSNND